MKLRCAVCSRIISTYVPKGGDGSADYPRPHKHPNGGWCSGKYEPAVSIDQKIERRE